MMHSIVSRKRSGFTLIELMIVIAIIAILAAILVPNFVRARAQGHLTACKSNLKNIGTALEMYSTDHAGRYPSLTEGLTTGNNGGYLKIIPTCPAAGSDTYVYTSTMNPDVFTIYCSGSQHTVLDVSTNFPQFNSVQGLVENQNAGN
ncbi:MAG: prepilin-type N-terminal cleavage/methylation domain-containing protein [bacterium]|nr:prepilin-type N-terminal cleavage/methylation domain-containing protein [bacterium]